MTDWVLKKLDHATTPQKAIALWGGDVSTLELINDGINVVYRFEVNKEGCYLRITHPSIRTMSELSSAIDYQNHLFLQGAPVCHPLKSRYDSYLEEIQQNDMVFYVHVNNEVPGHTIDIKRDNISIHKAWGRSLAELHCAAISYEPNENCRFLSWQDLWKEMYADVKQESEIIRQAYTETDDFLKTLIKNPNNFGLTHGDHRGANALYDNNRVHIIDFDEPVYHWFAADIACAFLCPEPFSTWRDKFSAFLDGYSSVRQLLEADMNNISWFMRMKSLGLYTWTKNNWPHSQVPGGGNRDEWLDNIYRLIVEPINLVGMPPVVL
ncbi:MAG: phosphotransferase [Gammaproteobacteria bacterium]|nr:phosphotransferase [Gammaproteobacteria bacterium]